MNAQTSKNWERENTSVENRRFVQFKNKNKKMTYNYYPEEPNRDYAWQFCVDVATTVTCYGYGKTYQEARQSWRENAAAAIRNLKNQLRLV